MYSSALPSRALTKMICPSAVQAGTSSAAGLKVNKLTRVKRLNGRGGAFVVELSRDELATLQQSLNEVLNGPDAIFGNVTRTGRSYSARG
jgi:hypothetical protein